MKILPAGQTRNRGWAKSPIDIQEFKSSPYPWVLRLERKHAGKTTKKMDLYAHGRKYTGPH